MIGTYSFCGFDVWGWVPGWWLISQGWEPLCVEVPFTLCRVYIGMVTLFWSTFVLGGGGGGGVM